MGNIAIDGPAGAGKSTVAKALAKKLGYLYIDTGAMYRALTLKALENNIDISDEEALKKLAQTTNIKLTPGEEQKVYLDEMDVTEAIRMPEVTKNVSQVAQYAGVREKLVLCQRKLAEKNLVVMDGRDIGTNVLPNAKYKFYLSASIHERAKRRYEELKQKGYEVDFDKLMLEIENRDRQDSSRKIAPLVQAPDAIFIDTTNLTPEEVIEKIYFIVREGE